MTDPDADEDNLRHWIERNVGGTMAQIERQPRWRRGWYASVAGVPGVDRLYIRGTRDSDFVSLPFESEIGFHDILERHGVPVPHVHGLCPDPRAIVMDLVPGNREISALSADRRLAVSAQYADILADIHAIEPRDFTRAGLWSEASPADAAIRMLEQYEASYRRNLKVRPEPFIEFMSGWLRRNVPRERTKMCFVTGDPGQFLADATGRITAIHDLEMGYIGDPLADLAPLRARHAFEPMGDVGLIMRRYEEKSGNALDRKALSYYLAWWGMTGAMWIARMLAEPNADHLRSLFSQVSGPYFAMQGVAEVLGIRLDVVAPIVPARSRRSATVGSLALLIDRMEATGDMATYRLDAARALADVLVQSDGLAAAIDRTDLGEVAQIVGTRPDNWLDADAELERFVQRAGPEHDATLLRFFDRRRQRAMMLLPAGYRNEVPGDIAGFADRLTLPTLSHLLDRPER